tara:strand:+ start:22942 stop:23340 length:399 start_codon:yes stop_codon:yes gene_type:complete
MVAESRSPIALLSAIPATVYGMFFVSPILLIAGVFSGIFWAFMLFTSDVSLKKSSIIVLVWCAFGAILCWWTGMFWIRMSDGAVVLVLSGTAGGLISGPALMLNGQIFKRILSNKKPSRNRSGQKLFDENDD